MAEVAEYGVEVGISPEVNLTTFPTALWPNSGFPQITAAGRIHVPVDVREGRSTHIYDVKEVKIELKQDGFKQEAVSDCHVTIRERDGLGAV